MTDAHGAGEFARLEAEAKAHPGRTAHREWRSLVMVIEGARVNEDALLDVVTVEMDHPEDRLRAIGMFGADPDAEQRTDGYWLELFVSLANFASMNYTLIEHVRRLMKRYEGEAFFEEDAKKRKPFLDAPETHFLKDLRTTITHLSTPPLAVSISGGESIRTTFAVTLESARLLREPERWDSASKKYLAAHERVNIREVVVEHARLRNEYYDWFVLQFEVLHRADVEGYNALVDRMDTFLPRLPQMRELLRAARERDSK